MNQYTTGYCAAGERELRKMRDKEFLREYRKTVKTMLDEGKLVVREEAIKRTLSNARPLFYVSFHRAHKVMCELHYRGKFISTQSTRRRAMWLDLYGMLQAEMKRHKELTLPEALARTLCTARASRFHLSVKYANRLLYKIIKESRKTFQL